MTIWSFISNIGISPKANSLEIRRAQMTNRMIFLALLLVSTYYPVFITQGIYTSMIQLAILNVMMISLFFVVNKGHHNLAAILLCVFIILHLVSVSFVIQGGTGRLYLIPVSIMGFTMLKNLKAGLFLFALSFIGFFISEFGPNYVTPLIIRDAKSNSILYSFNMIMIFVGTLYFIFQFIFTNRNYEKEILRQKDLIQEQHHALEESHNDIKDSIEYAQRIQGAILPPDKLITELLPEHFIIYLPKDIVAGDFYWVEKRENKIFFAAADCTGHGVPGALLSVLCNNALNRSVKEYDIYDPAQILEKTREIVVQEFEKSEKEVRDGMDIALCVIEGNKLRYSGAQNPMVLIREQEVTLIKAEKQPIGNYFVNKPFITHEIELHKGDMIYLFSDGYADQFGGELGKKFKERKMVNIFKNIAELPLDEQKQILVDKLEDWKKGYEQTDDICVFGVRF